MISLRDCPWQHILLFTHDRTVGRQLAMDHGEEGIPAQTVVASDDVDHLNDQLVKRDIPLRSTFSSRDLDAELPAEKTDDRSLPAEIA